MNWGAVILDRNSASQWHFAEAGGTGTACVIQALASPALTKVITNETALAIFLFAPVGTALTEASGSTCESTFQPNILLQKFIGEQKVVLLLILGTYAFWLARRSAEITGVQTT
jgi:hypothetical protein